MLASLLFNAAPAKRYQYEKLTKLPAGRAPLEPA